jgi:hypothetical protein
VLLLKLTGAIPGHQHHLPFAQLQGTGAQFQQPLHLFIHFPVTPMGLAEIGPKKAAKIASPQGASQWLWYYPLIPPTKGSSLRIFEIYELLSPLHSNPTDQLNTNFLI